MNRNTIVAVLTISRERYHYGQRELFVEKYTIAYNVSRKAAEENDK